MLSQTQKWLLGYQGREMPIKGELAALWTDNIESSKAQYSSYPITLSAPSLLKPKGTTHGGQDLSVLHSSGDTTTKASIYLHTECGFYLIFSRSVMLPTAHKICLPSKNLSFHVLVLPIAMVLMIDNDDVSSHNSCGDLEMWKLKKSEKNPKEQQDEN